MINICFLGTPICINLSIKSTISAQKLTNEIDSVSYSLGVNIGENLKTQFPDINLKNFELAIKDVLDNQKKPKISGADAQKIIQNYFQKQQAKASESVIEEGKKFLTEKDIANLVNPKKYTGFSSLYSKQMSIIALNLSKKIKKTKI